MTALGSKPLTVGDLQSIHRIPRPLPEGLSECPRCSAVVVNRDKHDASHG